MATTSALQTAISKFTVEQVLKNIVISENPTSLSYKRFILKRSAFNNSPQTILFNRLVQLFENEGAIEHKGQMLILESKHDSDDKYIGILDL